MVLFDDEDKPMSTSERIYIANRLSSGMHCSNSEISRFYNTSKPTFKPYEPIKLDSEDKPKKKFWEI
jgi:hypothetical protein